MMNVYLSGGMRSGWQQKVIEACPNIHFINPCDHGLIDSKYYSVWDILAVDVCDVVLAYMESDNPSGLGLAYECGYARGKGKLVIMVDDKMDRYMKIVHEHIVLVPSLDEAIKFLNSLSKIWREK